MVHSFDRRCPEVKKQDGKSTKFYLHEVHSFATVACKLLLLHERINTAIHSLSPNIYSTDRLMKDQSRKKTKCTYTLGQWQKNPGKRDGPAGRKSGAQRKTGLVGERQLQPYAPHGVKRTN